MVAFHVYVFLLAVCLLLSLARLGRLCWCHLQPSHSRGGAIHSTAQPLLKPRTPLDCPDCRLSCAHLSVVELRLRKSRPWSEVRSRRGAPKRINTQGFACPNQQCPYFGITDVHIHASFWRWQAWPGRTHPDISRPCLSHHVQCSTAHALVRFENPFSSDRHGADGAGRRTGRIRSRTDLRLPASDH